MTILAVDTTSNLASIALRSNNNTVREITFSSPDGFGHVVFNALEKLRNEPNFRLEEVDCFAAASGPGSFTGVRVGLSVVKGLAESMTKPVCGVSNLRALSSFRKNAGRLCVPLLDARRNQVYAAVYDQDLRLVSPETVASLDQWLSQLDPSGSYEFVFAAGSPFGPALAASGFSQSPVTEAPAALASAIALCADLDGREGAWIAPAALDANYVRRSDAELFWRDG